MTRISFFSLSAFITSAAFWGLVHGVAQAQSQQDEVDDATPMDCIDADSITGYQVISDELVRLDMAGSAGILMRLKRHCPQLHFHKYVAYTPVNGRLCARFDDITTRSGTPCRIESFSPVVEEEANLAISPR